MSSQLPSTQRPIPLKNREDLVVERIEYKGLGSWVIKDPVALKYHRLQPEQYKVLRLLDGQRNLEEIRDDLKAEFPTLTFTLADVQHLITDLHQKRLVYSNRLGQGASLLQEYRKNRKKRILGVFRNLLYLRLPGWDPEPTLRWMYPLVRWVFHPWAVWATVAFILSGYVLLAVQFDHFYSRLPEFQQFFGWPNLIYLWLTLGIAKVIHEFGHGLSCKHFRGECHEMGVMLLVFSPCLYCDASDSWMLKSKWQRIFIGGAGMYVEAVISSLALWLWWLSEPGLLNHLCINIFFVTSVSTVLFNANPLMRFDGYYMLSDFLEIPNLRPKSDKMLRDKFAWYCLGIETRPDPFMPETGKAWFVLYAIAAALYRWFILFGITLFLYTVLKPYDLQSIGITLAVVSMGGIIFNMGLNVYRILAAPRSEPLSIPKIMATLTVVVGLGAAAVLFPFPLHVEAAFLIEPQDVEHVYVTTSGILEEKYVEPGEEVEAGYVLAELSNIDLQNAYEDKLLERDMTIEQIMHYQSTQNSAGAYLARTSLSAIQAALVEYEKQLAELKLAAPAGGKVVAPPRKPRPKIGALHEQLPTYYGTPLDDRNQGCFLEAPAHFLSIAPNERLTAILLIDQADRNDVKLGQQVEIMFEHLPDRTYKGTIEEISIRHREFAPEALSNKGGGDLPTVTDPQGRERLTSVAYEATVLLEEDADLLKSGMRGHARFVVDHRSAWDWIWRYIRQTFHFRL